MGQPQQKLYLEQLRSLSRDPVCLLVGACILVPLIQLIQLCFSNPVAPGLALAIGVVAVVSMLAQFSIERSGHQKTLLISAAAMFILSTLGMALPLSLRSIETGFVLSGLILSCGVLALIAIGMKANLSSDQLTIQTKSSSNTEEEVSWSESAHTKSDDGLIETGHEPLNFLEESSDNKETIQQTWQRVLDSTGAERFEGTATIQFEPNQRHAHLHVPISPALAAEPEVFLECSDSDFTAQIEMAKTYGAAISVRRNVNASESAVEISLVMIAKSLARSDAA